MERSPGGESVYRRFDGAIPGPRVAPSAVSLAEWTSALANKNAAEASEKQARLTLDEAQAAFDATMDQIYGTLFAELGRKGADRYFP